MRGTAYAFQGTYPVIIGGNSPPPLTTLGGDIVPGLDLGVVAGLPPGTLRNQSNDPVMVTEIRFTNQIAASYSRRGGPLSIGTGSIAVEIRMGNVFLTRDFIPYWLLGQQIASGYLTTQTWRLPKPLLLPPGEEVFIRFKNLGGPSAQQNNPFVVNATLAGYGLEGCSNYPTKIPVPYITAYQGPIMSTSGIYDSNDTDLVNPFDVPMLVNRFVGALAVWNPPYANGSVCAYAEADQRLVTVQMVDHMANGTIRDAIQWGHLFGIDKSWQVNTVLPPKGYFLATVNVDYTTAISGISPLQPLIGMIGTREVALG